MRRHLKTMTVGTRRPRMHEPATTPKRVDDEQAKRFAKEFVKQYREAIEKLADE